MPLEDDTYRVQQVTFEVDTTGTVDELDETNNRQIVLLREPEWVELPERLELGSSMADRIEASLFLAEVQHDLLVRTDIPEPWFFSSLVDQSFAVQLAEVQDTIRFPDDLTVYTPIQLGVDPSIVPQTLTPHATETARIWRWMP